MCCQLNQHPGRQPGPHRVHRRFVLECLPGRSSRHCQERGRGGSLSAAQHGRDAGHRHGRPDLRPCGSQDAIGVAAVDVADAGGTGGVFNGTESVETFSSDGPRRIFFEADGTPITAGNFLIHRRAGVAEAGPDRSRRRRDLSPRLFGFPRHLGGCAARRGDCGLDGGGRRWPANVTQAALRTAMTSGTAVLDIEATGVDRDSGAGIVMAPGAVDAVAVAVADRNLAPTVTSTLTDRTFASGADAVMIDLDDIFDDPNDDTLTTRCRCALRTGGDLGRVGADADADESELPVVVTVRGERSRWSDQDAELLGHRDRREPGL